MAEKIACVIYTKNHEPELADVVKQLENRGFQVECHEVTSDVAAAYSKGDSQSLPDAVRECLERAEVCVLLFDEDFDEVFAGIGGLASDCGCRVVSVGGSPEDLPTDLDDIIDGHVPSAQSPDFPEIVDGKPDRVLPDGGSAGPRKPDRVKCQ